MSSTPSSWSRERSAKGWLPRATARMSSTAIGWSPDTIATTCWASTSRGRRGTWVSSIAPASMRSTTAAHSSRSPRYLGKMRPALGTSIRWPARPTRWMPRATLRGLSTCTTRSTAPMSTPSSRLLVATSAGMRPAFRSSSMSVRCSRARLPWWARATSSSASSFRRSASRSAPRRLLTKMRVLRWARTSSSSAGYMAGQMDRRVAPPPMTSSRSWPPPSPGPRAGSAISRMSSTGTITSRSRSFTRPASTTLTGRGAPSASWPPRKRAISLRGRCVALSPMRCTGPSAMRSSRSSDRARWLPRLVPAIAWISSTITPVTPRRMSSPRLVSSR